MKVLLPILNSIAYSNLYVSFCAVFLAAFILKIIGYPQDYWLLASIFSTTLFTYNIQRKISLYNSKKANYSSQNKWIRQFPKSSNFITLAAFFASLFTLYHLPIESLILLAPLATLSLLYILKIGKWPALRKIPFFKGFVVSLVWGGAIVILPVINESKSLISIFSFEPQLLSFALVFFFFAQSLPFDIRDMQEDEKENLKTIPQKIGIKRTLYLCLLCLLISQINILIAFFIGYVTIIELISFSLSLISTALIMSIFNIPRPSLYYAIILESCLCLPLIFYWILTSVCP